MKVKNFSIKWQLLIIFVLFATIPVVFLGVSSYNTVKDTTFLQIEERLQDQSKELNLFLESKYEQIQSSREAANSQAEAVVGEQAKAVYQLTQAVSDNNKLKDAISKISVGKTGYIWVVDYDGNYVVSKDRARDGENIWGAKDSTGRLFIQSAIAKGKKLSGNQIDYEVYPWKNAGESKARDKIAALIHIPSKGWIIGVSTYYDELVDMEFESKIMGGFKEELSEIVVGKTGYVYIINTKGDYVLSFQQSRDGENIWEAKDADGVLFIQEIAKKAKSLDRGETDVQYYPWKNTGENSARLKIAGFSYFPELDWVVASSAYQGDFLDGLVKVRNLTILITFFAVLICVGVAYVYTNTIVSKLNNLMSKMRKVADGDLTIKFDESKISGDEIGSISRAFIAMVQSLRDLVGNISTNASKTMESSSQLSASSQEVNASVKQVATTIEEIANGAQNLSKNSSDVAMQSKKTGESAKDGSSAAGEVGTKMDTILESTTKGAVRIKELGEKSKKIGDIVETINNISEQTNLLALNAAIEAARAGSAGRGFAVVADEVRKLAEESQKATGTISELISGIQSEIGISVAGMDESSRLVDEGVESVKNAVDAFNKIPELVEQVNRSISGISAVAEENAAGAEEVNASIEQVTSSMNQVANTAQEMSGDANALQKLVNRFKV